MDCQPGMACRRPPKRVSNDLNNPLALRLAKPVHNTPDQIYGIDDTQLTQPPRSVWVQAAVTRSTPRTSYCLHCADPRPWGSRVQSTSATRPPTPHPILTPSWQLFLPRQTTRCISQEEAQISPIQPVRASGLKP